MSNFFEESYAGTPPWDIGKPQREFVQLEKQERFRSPILDVGCGTGELSLYLASLGYRVTGIDAAARGVEKARTKARERKSNATFLVADALHLDTLTAKFETVVDCGLFHVFSDEEREVFRTSLESVLRPAGTYYMLVFSEKETREGGPRRVTQDEIRKNFQTNWIVNWIRQAVFDSRIHFGGAAAWLASLTYMPRTIK